MEEKVLLDVQMESAQAIKNISDLRSKVDELRKAQAELTKDKKGDELQTAKNSEEYITLGEQIKSLNKQIQENSKAVQDNDKFARNAEGSYNRLSAELARLKASYKAAATDEDRAAILENLNAVDERLKQLDADQGVYSRNVGNYAGGITEAFGKMAQSSELLGNAASILSGMGAEGKQAAMILQGLQKVLVFVGKAGQMNAAAQKAQATATAATATATTGAKTAQLGLNAAMAANPIGLIVTALTMVIPLLTKFASGAGKAEEAQEAFNKALDRLEEKLSRSDNALSNRIKILKAQGATEEEIIKEQLQNELDDYETLKTEENRLSSLYLNARTKKEREEYQNELDQIREKEKERTKNIIGYRADLQALQIKTERETAERVEKERKEAAKKAAENAKKEATDAYMLSMELSRIVREMWGYTTESAKESLQSAEDILKQMHQNIKDERDEDREDEEEDYRKRQDALDKYFGDSVAVARRKEIEELTAVYAEGLLKKEEYEKAKDDIQAKYEKQANEESAERLKERIENTTEAMSEWGGTVLDMADQVSALMSAKEDAELQHYEEQNEEKKASLQERLDAGTISQEEYDKQIADMDAELEKKQKETELKQAKRNKAIALMEAVINMALGISKAVAQNPMLGGLPGSAIAATMGALQIATIAAEPLPKASRGALLRGKSHAQGGIPIEAEGGEAIINKRATQRYLPLLSAINQSTGGVPLYANGGMPQQVMRQTEQALFNQDQFLQAVASIKPQVAVTDINRGQDNMVTLTERRAY